MDDSQYEQIVDDFMKEYDLWNKEDFVSCGIGIDDKKPYLHVRWLKDKTPPSFPPKYKELKVVVTSSDRPVAH